MSSTDTAPPALIDRLRRQGYRLTAQRRAVASVLHGRDVHLTADEVLSAAREILPEVSRATVYGTLHEWVEMGEIRELTIEGRSKRYDPNVTSHHHLVCDGCGLVIDVQHGVEPPPIPTSERGGIRVDRSEIVHYGRCTEC